MICSGALSPTKGICTRTVGSSLGNSVKCPAMVLTDLRSAAIRTEDFVVPGMIYATCVSGRLPSSEATISGSWRGIRKSFKVPVSPASSDVPLLFEPVLGAGDVILMRPFRITESLGYGQQVRCK